MSKHALKRIVDAINESPERVLNVKQRDRLLRLAEHQALLCGLGFRASTLNPKPFKFRGFGVRVCSFDVRGVGV